MANAHMSAVVGPDGTRLQLSISPDGPLIVRVCRADPEADDGWAGVMVRIVPAPEAATFLQAMANVEPIGYEGEQLRLAFARQPEGWAISVARRTPPENEFNIVRYYPVSGVRAGEIAYHLLAAITRSTT